MYRGFGHGSGSMGLTNVIAPADAVVKKMDKQLSIKPVNGRIDLASIHLAKYGLETFPLFHQILIRTIPPKRGGRWTQALMKRFVDLKELSFLCGLIRSDGSKREVCIGFCNTSLELIKNYLQIMEKLGLFRYLRAIITHNPAFHEIAFVRKKFEKETGLPTSGVYVNKAGVKIAYRIDIYNSAISRLLLAVEKELRQLYSGAPQLNQYAIHYLKGVAAGDGSLCWKERPGLYFRISEIDGKARREIASIMRMLGMRPFTVQTKNKPPYISTYVTSNTVLVLLSEGFFATSHVNMEKIFKAMSVNARFKILLSIHEAFGLENFTARQAAEVRRVNHRSFRRTLNNYVKLGLLSVKNMVFNGQITKSYRLTERGSQIAKAMKHALKELDDS